VLLWLQSWRVWAPALGGFFGPVVLVRLLTVGLLSVGRFAGRWEWSFGDRSTPPDELVDFSVGTGLVERLWDEITRWGESVEALDQAAFDQIGFSQHPDGMDAHLPFITIVRWMNRETIHHLAEIALLRDPYVRCSA
jgi:hypothetical protein